MMVLSVLRPDASLPEFLAHRAKSASVRRLSIDLVIGLAGFSAAVHWSPSAWLVLASLALCLFAYGGWGIADRARSSTATSDNLLLRALTETLCTLMIAAGTLAVGSLLFSVWAIALGTWIS
jgi:hypothetical protein